MKKAFEAIGNYIWKHCSAIFLMTNIICIMLCNPFVVDKYQALYRCHVTVIGSIIWDVIWIAGCVGCGFLEHFIRKCEQ